MFYTLFFFGNSAVKCLLGGYKCEAIILLETFLFISLRIVRQPSDDGPVFCHPHVRVSHCCPDISLCGPPKCLECCEPLEHYVTLSIVHHFVTAKHIWTLRNTKHNCPYRDAFNCDVYQQRYAESKLSWATRKVAQHLRDTENYFSLSFRFATVSSIDWESERFLYWTSIVKQAFI